MNTGNANSNAMTPLRPAFRYLYQLHHVQVSCGSALIVFIITRLQKQAIQQYCRAIRSNLDHNDQLVIISIHGNDLSSALKEYPKQEILEFTDMILGEVRSARRGAAAIRSKFILARTSLIQLLHILAYVNPGTRETLKESPCRCSINRLLPYLRVHRCSKDCASRSQSLGVIVDNLIDSMDALSNMMYDLTLVEQGLKNLHHEVGIQKTPLYNLQVPEHLATMGEKCRSQASGLRNLEDLYWNVFRRFKKSTIV
ncbi:hypothetical protein C8J56DRAFT_923473 [Mycena floridula]|nr:hypothetical protein C8J56DRAFT_923473 [Mycena floridula]